MRTYLDCIPCFFKQALDAGQVAGADDARLREIVDRLAAAVPGFDLAKTPPELSLTLYSIVAEVTKNPDIYRERKEQSISAALEAYPHLRHSVAHAKDRLLRAAELAIAGNISDFGLRNTLNLDSELKQIIARADKAAHNKNASMFDYDGFRARLEESGLILYLADNAGETVFDAVLLEEMLGVNPGAEIIYAVKERPIINDALRADAVASGIDRYAKIVSTGADTPGAVFGRCTREFTDLFGRADMVISKGQGNFEALSGIGREVFFLFMTKCQLVVRHIREMGLSTELGDINLFHHRGSGR